MNALAVSSLGGAAVDSPLDGGNEEGRAKGEGGGEPFMNEESFPVARALGEKVSGIGSAPS